MPALETNPLMSGLEEIERPHIPATLIPIIGDHSGALPRRVLITLIDGRGGAGDPPGAAIGAGADQRQRGSRLPRRRLPRCRGEINHDLLDRQVFDERSPEAASGTERSSRRRGLLRIVQVVPERRRTAGGSCIRDRR